MIRKIALFALPVIAIAALLLLVRKPQAQDRMTSDVNSTTTALAAAESFTGAGVINEMPDVATYCIADQDGTLFYDFSLDGTTWYSFPTAGFDVSANIPEFHTAVKLPRYFRTRFVNGSTDQGSFNLQTYFGTFRQGNTPLNSSFGADHDTQLVRAFDTSWDAALGRLGGFSVVNKFGKNPDIDSISDPANYETVWNGGGQYTWPSTARTIVVTSDDIADTGTVTITGLDASYAEISETVTLPAENPNDVTTTATFLRVNRVRTAGTVDGTVTGVTTTDTITVFSVDPAERSSQLGLYTVPEGKNALFLGLMGSAARGGTAVYNLALYARTEGGDFTQEGLFGFSNTTPSGHEFKIPKIFAEHTDIEFRIVHSTGTNALAAVNFDVVLVEN